MTRDEIARILAFYDLGECQDCRRVVHGYVNDNWIVWTATGQYFLKRRRPDLSKPDLVAAQHALVQHLHSAHFPAPTIVPTRRGETFLEFQNGICEIHRYIPGDLCNPSRPAHFATAARTLGQYHNAVQGFDHQVFHRPHEHYGPASLTQIIDRLMRSWRNRTSSELDRMVRELREHARDLQNRFSEFGELPELVIHGDYYAENLIFQEDEVVGVVDYDLAHWCMRGMEVAEAMIYFATERPGRLKHIVYPGVLDLDAVYRFLTAYTETAFLSDSEIYALPHLIRATWLCASLDPPLEPLLRLEEAPQALPEVLTLAGWAQAHASDIVEIGLAARAKQSAGC